MPGLVVRVEVEPGMVVQAGQGLVIIEAMKMENELRAPGPARVRAVHVQAGIAVEKDAMLVEFESLEGGGEG
jgi:pyruvate carboxylase subunit B